MTKNILTLSAACAFLVVGCGGGSSSTDSGNQSGTDSGEGSNAESSTILTGVFVDSAVEGAAYSTPTQTGTTNSAGEFNYLEGEQVVFSIGATVLPSVAGAPQVSPVEMAAGSNDSAATTTNIARLLQSLDIDGNPDNGITISPTLTTNAATLDFNVSVDDFANNTDVINLVANSGSTTMALISADDANAHLNDTLGTATETSIDGLWIRNSAQSTESNLADYSFVDGNNVTRYNSTTAGCYTVSTNTATPLENNRFQLNADNGPIFYTAVRVGDVLEVTFDGEPTLSYPRANGIDRNTLPLCDAEANNSGASNFNQTMLVDGSPWYAIRDFGGRDRPDTCGNRYSFTADGSLTVIFKGVDETDFQTASGTYTLTDSGVLTLLSGDISGGQIVYELNDLSSASWSVNRADTNDAGAYLETAFSDRASALSYADGLGTNCEFNLPM